MNEPSKLPAAQQVRREALQKAQDEAAAVPAGPVGVVTKPNVVSLPTGEPVVPATPNVPVIAPNISDAELRDLREKADEAVIAKRKLEKAEMELREAEARLTELEKAAKGSSSAPPVAPVAPVAPSALRMDPGAVALSEDEAGAYGEAEPVISKIARREVSSLVNPLLDALEIRLARLEGSVSNVATTTAQTVANNFVEKVKAAVTPAKFEAIIKHPKWNDFLFLDMPGAGMPYGKAVEVAHAAQNLGDMQHIFNTFAEKYKESLAADPASGYSGISGTNTQGMPVSGSSTSSKKLKYSDRKKASDDRLKGRISAAELAVIRAEFEKAEAAGLVDYDN